MRTFTNPAINTIKTKPCPSVCTFILKKVHRQFQSLPKTLIFKLVSFVTTRTSLLFSDFKNTLESGRKNPLGKKTLMSTLQGCNWACNTQAQTATIINGVVPAGGLLPKGACETRPLSDVEFSNENKNSDFRCNQLKTRLSFGKIN